MSHCYGCTRFSTATVATHLATHGFVVVAPDHVGDTLFDKLAGIGLPLDGDTLAVREADVQAAHRAALAGELGVDVDPEGVVAFGHSFGAVTVGRFLHEGQGLPGGPKAALFVGRVAALDVPLVFLRLLEDHSIGETGNLLIAANFASAVAPAWKVDMAEAGHWSPSDLVGVLEDFMPECGEDERAVSGEPFSCLSAFRGRAFTGEVAAAFFSWAVNGGGAAPFDGLSPELEVTANAAAP